jgi:hypothetical protein
VARRTRILAVVAILVAALVATVLVVALRRHTNSLTTPASIDGMPQIHGTAADALAEQARVNAGQDAQGVLVGVYGRGQLAGFIFVVRETGGGGLGTLERLLTQGVSPSGSLEHHTQDGVRYDCGIVRAATTMPLAFCFFDDGKATGAGLVLDTPSIDRVLRLTSSGRLAAES